LRILDSKDPQDQEWLKDAPVFGQYLSDISRQTFEKVSEGLGRLGITYKHNPYLVRGLDYYCHTAFEFTTTDLGSQGAVLAGGRYDGLVTQMGGPPTPGVGWAMGIDRVALMMNGAPSQPRPIAVIAVGEEVMMAAFQLAMDLRKQGVMIEFPYTGNMGKRMKRADKVNACAAIFVGADEIAASQAMVRNLDTGDQNRVAFAALKDYLVDTFPTIKNH
jgi:histidyl-tRNA synthetase